jgi:hypothetical protein
MCEKCGHALLTLTCCMLHIICFVFVQVNVVYKRNHGGVGHIEPGIYYCSAQLCYYCQFDKEFVVVACVSLMWSFDDRP